MIELGTNHCQVVKDALKGKRTVDEQTLDSISVLGHQLEKLKQADKMFTNVEFSSAVQKLLLEEDSMLLC